MARFALLVALALHSLAALLIAAIALGAEGGMCLKAGVATTVAGRARMSAAQTTLVAAGVILCVFVIALAIAIARFEFSIGDRL